MIRYLIKNNFKIMFRSATNILILTLAPIVVSAVLISAFSSIMKKYQETGDFKVGYSYNSEETQTIVIDGIRAIAEEQGISFVEYKNTEPKDALEDDKLAGFVDFGKDSYTVYKTDEAEAENQILEYILHAYYENMSMVVSGQMLQGSQQTADTKESAGETDTEKIQVQTGDFMPAVDSTDYYGIIYLVYFGWCCIVCGAGLFTAEKKYGIEKREMMSGISELKAYLSKFVPLVAVTCAGLSLYGVASVVLFGVNWGNAFLSILIIILGIMAATALGLMVYSLCDNMVVTVIVVFMLVWYWGFSGGSFETYMFSQMPQILKSLSPIYYENRALVELSCMGSTDYVLKSIAVLGGMTVLFSGIAVLVSTLRRRGKKS